VIDSIGAKTTLIFKLAPVAARPGQPWWL
jgi:hypothetical protein